jgi:DNA-binding beta-propeller fold protein YncE
LGNTLKKLDSSGSVIQTVFVGHAPELPVFDGANIWVPNIADSSVTVVRVRDGLPLATLTDNGLSGPVQAAFDGQFILVTNINGSSVSLWKAADLTPVGSFPASNAPRFACSDGVNFWISLFGDQLARF